ncbi:MAG: leucine--tRNA ligase [Candidatus Woesearchaeota archaeon]
MPDFNSIAAKWQRKWEESKVFQVKEDPKKKKYYVLEMYPYPSASGLHLGHSRNYVIGDVFARFKRMNGFNVLYPMGYDSFGLPAENAAINARSHPKVFTDTAIKNYIRQQHELGCSYDWSRVLMSHDPNYYKWDQWIFLKMFEKGLVYKKKSAVNWCPKCKTVLANEQVHSGKCWRHTDTDVELKDLEQWFIKITNYAEELLNDIDKLTEWPEDVKIMQRNWIGKSMGTLIDFKIESSDKVLTVFTTRPDTLFGITYLVYAPEHPDVLDLVKGTKLEEPVKKFIKKVVQEDRFTRTAEDKEKEGLFIGRYAIHPVTNDKIPIYIANFVLYEYGTGAIIAVPAHDQRDFDFAKKFKIPIKVVINPPDFDLSVDKMSRAYVSDGTMVNSGDFNGTNNRDAIGEITLFLEKIGHGRKTVQYKLRDWLISRQRFWGCPIPLIYCDKHGVVPVPEKDLPVILPEDFKFTIGEGNPLEHCEEFVHTKCPKCGSPAQRETDTMDTFMDSSWYFLRFCDPHSDKLPFDPKKSAYWMPIDAYIGGREHATMHLIYFRFVTKFLRDIGLCSFDEPAKRLFNQGMLHKGGSVMSKSKGNVVTQEEIAKRFGIDTARFFMMFVASPDKDMEWDDKGVEGSFRFLNKLYFLVAEKASVPDAFKNQESTLHKTIKDVTYCIENFRYNQALIALMQLTNYLASQEKVSKNALEKLIIMLSPFVPHICEELWEHLGNKPFVSLEKWPSYDESKIDLELEAQESMVEQTVKDVLAVLELAKISEPKSITLFVAEKWKFDFFKRLKSELEKTHDVSALIKAVMDKSHSKEISQLVPRIVKDLGKMPALVLDQKTEIYALAGLESRFKAPVQVVAADNSTENKARQALPGKPAIIVH